MQREKEKVINAINDLNLLIRIKSGTPEYKMAVIKLQSNVTNQNAESFKSVLFILKWISTGTPEG